MSSPDPLRDYGDEQQQYDLDKREWELMEALWAVHHAGLEEEATTLAYGCGLGTQWQQEKGETHARSR